MQVLVSRVGKERIYTEAVDSHIDGWFRNAPPGRSIRPVARPEYEYELPRRRRGFQLHRHRRRAAEGRGGRLDEARGPRGRGRGAARSSSTRSSRRSAAPSPSSSRPRTGRRREGDTLVVDIVGRRRARSATTSSSSAPAAGRGGRGGARRHVAGRDEDVAYELADEPTATVEMTVKEMKEKVLPQLDDELARSASEFDTLDELRADIEQRLREQIEEEVETQFRAAAVDALVEASDVEPSGPLVESRTRRAPDRPHPLARAARDLARDLPRGHEPDAAAARGADPRRGGAVGRARARARGRRRQARDRGHRRRGPRVRPREGRRGGRRRRRGDRAALRHGRHELLREDLRHAQGARPGRGRGEADPARARRRAREALDAREEGSGRAETKMWTPGSKEPA